jgi:anti-anti-sigma factor
MSKEIEISTSTTGEVAVIRVGGDVTAGTGGAIENAYQELSKTGLKKFLLHFEPETYINSGGIAVLIGIASGSVKQGQVFHLAGLSDHFKKIFTMVGLTKYMKIFPSEEAALNGF